MTTLSDIRASLRNLLTDKTQWRDSLLNSWVQDAVRDYSLYFPLLVQTTIDCVAAQKSYDLSSYTLYAMRSVEYPTGETPRRLLNPLRRTHALFDGGGYYDLAADFSTLYIGESPAAGESILIAYDSVHTVPLADGTELTIPLKDSELIRLYVIWKACLSLEMDENVSVNRKREMTSSLGLNATRAERAYRHRLRESMAAGKDARVAGQWLMDGKDRIY